MLHVYDDLPMEYIEFILCRDVYHCRLSELNEEPWENVALHIAFMKAENKK